MSNIQIFNNPEFGEIRHHRTRTASVVRPQGCV